MPNKVRLIVLLSLIRIFTCDVDAEECWVQMMNNLRGLPAGLDESVAAQTNARKHFVEQYMMCAMQSE